MEEALAETEEGRAAAEAAEREKTTILASLPDTYRVLDHDRRVRYLNPEAAKLVSSFGKDPDQMTHRVLWEAVPELAATKLPSETSRALAENVVVEYEELVAQTGTWLNSRIIPTADSVVWIARDVTEQSVPPRTHGSWRTLRRGSRTRRWTTSCLPRQGRTCPRRLVLLLLRP